MNQNKQQHLRNIAISLVTQKQAASDLFSSHRRSKEGSTQRKNIIIVGGELFNKGAQAMTFTVVDQLQKRYPEKNVYLFSKRDFERPTEEKSQYSFDILPWGPEMKLRVLSNGLNWANTTNYTTETSEKVAGVLSNCAGIVDINGYALSSQMGFDKSLLYMLNVMIAKNIEVPMYILPQSIGPFDYSLPKQLFLNPLLNIYLSYPRVICPRERAGVESLSRYTQNNVSHEFDLVLQAEQYDLENVYTKVPKLERKELTSDAVGVVPNTKVFERMDQEKFYAAYEQMISKLLSEGHTVYIFRHSFEDLDLCKGIKSLFEDNEKVILFEDDLNAIELEHVIDQCQFLIASRYHSIVHSYKNHVPVIAIGWAIKYKELLDEFDQVDYFFDCRAGLNESGLHSAIELLSEEHDVASQILETKLKTVQDNNIFERELSTLKKQDPPITTLSD